MENRVTATALQAAANAYQVGEHIVRDGKSCTVLQKMSTGLLLKKHLHRDVAVPAFVTYAELAAERKEREE